MENSEQKILILKNCFFGVIKDGERFWYKKEEYRKIVNGCARRMSDGERFAMSSTEIVEEVIKELKWQDRITEPQAKVLIGQSLQKGENAIDIIIQTNLKDKTVIKTEFLTEDKQVIDTFYWIKEVKNE